MAKGAKKRRAIRKKKKDKFQISDSSAKVEFPPLEHEEEDVLSPKTPVQASEGGDTDRVFNADCGSTSPTSQIEHKSPSFETLSFHYFSAFVTNDVGNSEALKRDGATHVQSEGSHEKLMDWGNPWGRESTMPGEDGVDWFSKEHNAHGNDAILHDSQFGAVQGDNPKASEKLQTALKMTESITDFDQGFSWSSVCHGKLESAIVNRNEGLPNPQEHNEYAKDIILDNLAEEDAETSNQLKDELVDMHLLAQPTSGSLEKLETHEAPAYQAHDLSCSESLEIGPGKHEGLQFLKKQAVQGKEITSDNSESSLVEILKSREQSRPDDIADPQMLTNAIASKLSISEFPRVFCMTSEGVHMNSSQSLSSWKNPEKLGSNMPHELEGLRFLQKQYRDGNDTSLNRSKHSSVDTRNQPTGECTSTNLPKEDAFLERLVVSFPATGPDGDTDNPLIPADLESKESSSVVLQDTEMILEQKSKDDNCRDFRAIATEHTQQFVRHNREENDIHAKSALPEELNRGDKENDMVLQSKEKFGRKFGFCGLLEFLLCWRD